MTRSCLALGAFVAAVGCAGLPGSLTATSSEPAGLPADGRGVLTAHPAVSLTGPATASPQILRGERYAGVHSRMSRGVGYYWFGVTPVNVPRDDLITRVGAGSGDGVSAGVGLKFSESSRSFFEIAIEKTFNHEVRGPATGGVFDWTPPEDQVQTGYHDRLLVGGRAAAAARARVAKQPRPYMSYGASTNEFGLDRVAGSYESSSLGLYLGMGVEFPFGESQSFAFDAKYHTWGTRDSTGEEGTFSTIAISILLLGRF